MACYLQQWAHNESHQIIHDWFSLVCDVGEGVDDLGLTVTAGEAVGAKLLAPLLRPLTIDWMT